jgi:hypothetical protein
MENPCDTVNDPAGAAPPPAELDIHPSAAIFPPMREAEFAALVADIRDKGQLEPVWTHEGKVIDGRHRLLACRKLGIAPRTRAWDGAGSLLEFIISANLRRRHLKENQRAMVAARMLPQFEAEALMRKGVRGAVSDDSDNCRTGRAVDHGGLLLGVSGKSVERARNLLKKGIPELIARVDAGKLAVSTAAKVAELPPEEQTRLLALSRLEIARALRPKTPAPVTVPVSDPTPESIPASDPEQERRDQLLLQQLPTGGAKLTRSASGFRLEFSAQRYLEEFKTVIHDHDKFLALLERGVFMVKAA